jgi:hypothetical protein
MCLFVHSPKYRCIAAISLVGVKEEEETLRGQDMAPNLPEAEHICAQIHEALQILGNNILIRYSAISSL